MSSQNLSVTHQCKTTTAGNDLFFEGLQNEWAWFFGFTFSHKLSPSLGDGPFLQFDTDQCIFTPKTLFHLLYDKCQVFILLI